MMTKREQAQQQMRTWRAYYGLSQQEMAERLGCGREWLAKLETTDMPIGAALAERIWRVTSANPFEISGIPPELWND